MSKPIKNSLNGFSGEWKVEEVIKKVSEKSSDSFYLCNLSDVIKKFDDWAEKIPRVKTHYAVSFQKFN